MNQLEIFKATVAHEKHDQYLFSAGFTWDLEIRLKKHLNLKDDEDLYNYFGLFYSHDVNLEPPEGLIPADFTKYYSDMEIPENAFINGLGVLEVPGSLYHFTEYISPLRNARSLKEVEDFPFPNVDGYTDVNMRNRVESIHAHNMVAGCNLTHMYDDSWQIRGYVPFLTDMIENPEICEFILDKITERNLRKATAAAKAGVDVIVSGDDVANQRDLMFSPELWRKFIKPRWAMVYQAVKEIKPDIQIWYHSDGNIERIIPELIEIGVTILNPVQPECLDIYDLKRKYGDKLVFDGTIGTQSTMPFGTVSDVKRAVKDRIERLGYDGALILSPTHVLEPDVPIDNVLAFVEACGGRI